MLSFEEYLIFADIDEQTQMKWFHAYADSLHDHIDAVYTAGNKLKVSFLQLIHHDDSKWSVEEFPHYARQFFGDKEDPTGWARAWLHHLHYNPHHWQHWIFPDNFKKAGADIESGVLEMPEKYALEMVADWMGASYSYTDSWDMTEWLRKQSHKITLHSKTAEFVEMTLLEMGYEAKFSTRMVTD